MKIDVRNVEIKKDPNANVQEIPIQDYAEWKKSGVKSYAEWKKVKKNEKK